MHGSGKLCAWQPNNLWSNAMHKQQLLAWDVWLGIFLQLGIFSLGSLADDLSFRNFATSDLWLDILRLSSSLCLTSEILTIFGEVCAPPKWGSPCKLKAHCMGQGNWALCKLWFWDLCDSHLNSTWSSTHNILGRDQGCTLCRSTLCLHSSIAYPLWSRYHHLAALQHFRLLWPCSLHRQLWQPSSLSPPLEWRSNTREP